MNTTLGLFLSSSILLVSGCIGARETGVARARAASDLGCPESQVQVDPVAGNGYVAYGCSKSEQLTCMTTTNPNPLFPSIKQSEVSCISGGVHDDGPNVSVEQVNAQHAAEKEAAAAKAAKKEDEDAKAFVATLRAVLKSIPYRDCGPGGAGQIEITLEPQGKASDVVVVAGAYDLSTTACVAERFKHVRVDAFEGEPRTYTWKIDLGKPD